MGSILNVTPWFWNGVAALAALPVGCVVLRYGFLAARKGETAWGLVVMAVSLVQLALPPLGFMLARQQRTWWFLPPGLSLAASVLLIFFYALFLRMDGP